MSDMAATACGRRWPCAAPQRVVVQRPAQVRLPAFVHVNYDGLSVPRCGSASMACPGRARDAVAAAPLWESCCTKSAERPLILE